MNNQDLMTASLSGLLEEGESLSFPFYGILIQKKRNFFGFFALTDTALLISLPSVGTNADAWEKRVPLDIESSSVKKCLMPGQYIINLSMKDGGKYCIRASKKMIANGLENQEKNLSAFIEEISKY